MFIVYIICGTLFLIGWFLKSFHVLYILRNKPDKTSKRHGGELVAEVLKAHKVDFIFTLVGGHISPILVAAEKIGIRIVDTRHEATAAFAADAMSRLSGKIGVAVVTAGPGVTNTITAVKNAQLAESPLLLIGGSAATILKGRGALQDVDQLTLLQSVCKFSASVTCVRKIVPTLKMAIKRAMSGTPGPVFVEIPVDVLYTYDIVKKEIGAGSTAKTLFGKAMSWYLTNYLHNIFAGAWAPVDTDPLPIEVPILNKVLAEKAAQIISRAKRPILLIGSQALLPPNSPHTIRKVVEAVGIPCYLGGMARGLLGGESDVQVRHNRRRALAEADVIILAGMVCDFRLAYGRILNKKAEVIAVNRNKRQLKRNAGIFWKPAVALSCDAGMFLEYISTSLAGYKCDPDWLSVLRSRDLERDDDINKMSQQSTDVHLNPIKILKILDNCLPQESVLVADGGDFVGTAAYILRPRGPLGWLDPGAFGTLGVGAGFAMAAKLLHPEKEVWIVWGDGSSGFSICDYDTFSRLNIPVISIVGNDGGWTQILRDQVTMLGAETACKLQNTDYHTVAEGFGAVGIKLDRKDDSRIEEVIRKAQKLNAEGKSVLINALIGKTSFREGSIAV